MTMLPRYRCRLFHTWDEADSNHWTATMGVPFTLRCQHCGTERRDQIGGSTGALVTRRYVYPAGYLYAADEIRLDRDTLRMMLVHQAINGARRRRVGAKR